MQIDQRGLESLSGMGLLLELRAQIPDLGLQFHHAIFDAVINLGTGDGDGIRQLHRGGGGASLRLRKLHLELTLAFTRSLERRR